MTAERDPLTAAEDRDIGFRLIRAALSADKQAFRRELVIETSLRLTEGVDFAEAAGATSGCIAAAAAAMAEILAQSSDSMTAENVVAYVQRASAEEGGLRDLELHLDEVLRGLGDEGHEAPRQPEG